MNQTPSVSTEISSPANPTDPSVPVNTPVLVDRTFLKRMSTIDTDLEGPETCGQHAYLRCLAEAARQLLKEYGDDLHWTAATAMWDRIAVSLWRDTPFHKLYMEEIEAGRNPEDAFKERGWTL